MEIGTISLIVSGFVAFLTGLKFIIDIVARKEASEDKLEGKFAKVESVNNEFYVIKRDIAHLEDKLEDHGAKINNLQMQGAVLNSQMSAQLRELEKLGNKIDEWRNNE